MKPQSDAAEEVFRKEINPFKLRRFREVQSVRDSTLQPLRGGWGNTLQCAFWMLQLARMKIVKLANSSMELHMIVTPWHSIAAII